MREQTPTQGEYGSRFIAIGRQEGAVEEQTNKYKTLGAGVASFIFYLISLARKHCARVQVSRPAPYPLGRPRREAHEPLKYGHLHR